MKISSFLPYNKWTASSEFGTYSLCEQRRFRRACASAVSPEPSLLAHTSSESRGTFRQKARSLAPLNGWACAVKICHDGMLEDTNSLDAAQIYSKSQGIFPVLLCLPPLGLGDILFLPGSSVSLSVHHKIVSAL